MNSRARQHSAEPASGRGALLMLLAPLPALITGVLVMQRSGLSPAIWGQQLGAGFFLMTLCAGLRVVLRRNWPSRSWARALVVGVALLLLTATLAHPGVEGVRRWISLGPVQLHAAFVVIPALLIVLCAIVRQELLGGPAWRFPCLSGTAGGVLMLQPDASQASAFAVAAAAVLLQRGPLYSSHWAAGSIVFGAALLAWWRPDPLEAVPHVEGIMGLAATLGGGWVIASALALALLPLPFIVVALSRREHRPEGYSLAAYFGMVCVAPLVGPYPVPILGFGLSPILGYFAALGWIIRRDGAAHSEVGPATGAHQARAV